MIEFFQLNSRSGQSPASKRRSGGAQFEPLERA
jgi:hypothetical protein